MIGNGVDEPKTTHSITSEPPIRPFPSSPKNLPPPSAPMSPPVIPSSSTLSNDLGTENTNITPNAPVQINTNIPPKNTLPLPPAAPTAPIQTQRTSSSLDTDDKIQDILEITYFAKAALHHKGMNVHPCNFFMHT